MNDRTFAMAENDNQKLLGKKRLYHESILGSVDHIKQNSKYMN